MLAGACSGSGPTATATGATQQVTGLVISAAGPDSSSVERFSLRTDDGTVYDFVVGTLDVANGGLPAPHLREHMVNAARTTVFYRVENGQNVAVRYTDADE